MNNNHLSFKRDFQQLWIHDISWQVLNGRRPHYLEYKYVLLK